MLRAPRWATFLAGSLLVMACASGTLWGVYSPYLKDRLHFSQSELNGAVTANLVGGGILSFLVGMFYDKFGPRATIALGSVMLWTPLGYYLWETQDPSKASVAVTIIVTGFSGIGLGALFTSSIGPSLSNYPKSKGLVSAIISSLFNISVGIFSQINEWVFLNNITHLWILLMSYLTFASIFGFIFTNILQEDDVRQSFAHEDYDPIKIVSVKNGSVHHSREVSERQSLIKYPSDDEEERELLSQPGVPSQNDIEWMEKQLPNLNSLQILATGQFWSLALAFLVFQGCSNLILYEMGAIVSSEGGAKRDTNTYVTVYSVVTCVSTIVSGIISDRVRHRFYPPGFFSISLVTCGLGYALLYVKGFHLLAYATGFIAVSNGMAWAVLPSIISDMWGFAHFGSNMAVAGIAAAVGSYILPNVVAGHFYNKHSTDGGLTCYGPECFRNTWIICVAFSIVGLFGSLALYWFTRRVYHLKMAIRESKTPSQIVSHIN